MKRFNSWVVVASLLFLIFGGCFTRPTLMTRESYDEIYLGTPLKEVKERVGTPYQVRSLGGGKEEYEYVERIDIGNRLVMENHYFLILMEGQVISKRFSQQRPPAYDIIYYD